MESSTRWGEQSYSDSGAEGAGFKGSDAACGSNSIGEQIDGAIGEFDAHLTKLRLELEQKQAEAVDLERQIEQIMKEQAKAFKQLLTRNPMIKEMLSPKAKRRTMRSRKTSSDAADESGGSEAMR